MRTLSYYYVTLLSSLFLLVSSTISAFNYTVNFTASGAGTTIDQVIVQNLTQGTTITVTSGNTLQLTPVEQVNANDESVRVYPNPMQDKATVSFYSSNGGNTTIDIFGIDGKKLVGVVKNINVGINTFQVTLPKGAFAIQFNESGIIHTAKILSQSNNNVGIEFIGHENTPSNIPQKAKSTAITMPYNLGDLILYKAYSGNYVSILTDIVSESKTINFNFVECKDVDGNYYSTVTVGTQVWMAENLKTSRYRNNITITDKTNLSTWGTSTTEASSDYATPSNSTTYGKLYNWYAASSSNNLAPLGWHIPADADWTTLSDFLGGLNLAGNKLKENGNSHWATANTTATNSTGFTAIPGGSRSTDNTVYDIGNIGYWWSSTEGTSTNNAWYRSLSNQNGTVTRGYFSKSGGMSVRCLMGDFPMLTTTSASSITSTSFVSGGSISYNGNYPITSCGVCWSTNQNPTINDSKTSDSNSSGTFTSNITGLTAQTTYYVRAYATNNYGTAYGTQLTVSTALPTITTTAISSITTSAATSGGTVGLPIGAATVTARGICWSINQNPTITDNHTSDGTGLGVFISSITGLTGGITYYVRAYATNSAGTAYGSQMSFSPFPSVTDIDGNVYHIVTIGTQVWMSENLKTTHYQDGTAIPLVTDGTSWAALQSGAYCDFSNNSVNGSNFGHLYNFFAVIDSRNLAPKGWHIPSDAEWTVLSNYLGGSAVAGGKMKEAGTTHWSTPNTGADNSSGFNAIGGSWRSDSGSFLYDVNIITNWWSKTVYDTNNSWLYSAAYDKSNLTRTQGAYYGKKGGLSIRCIKD
ncbi:MAG: FISUMP domain-containing protein [Bacteroidales bacterium]